MSTNDLSFITTPVGRMVWGSISKMKTKDGKGNPIVYKTGPDIGKPAPRYEFGIAIPKAGETHWNQTAWGRLIWDVGTAGFPNGQTQRADFSWKITDGDSPIPNKKGVAPNTRVGHPGHWVLAFSSSFAPEVLDSTGRSRVDPSTVKLGYYIQVAGSVKSNSNVESPGVYLNSKFVSFQAYGQEIVLGPDPSQVGFGQAALPAGASAAPVGGSFVPPSQAPAGAPVAPTAAPVAYTPPPAAPAMTPPPAAPAIAPPVAPAPPAPVVPHTSILTPKVMTAKAAGATYEQFIASGWTDAMLRSEGYMV